MLGQNASEWDGKDMWSGFTLGTDLCMMIKKDIGIGAKVNYRNQTKAFPYEYGTLTLKRNYWFVGPEFIYRPRTFNNKGAGIFGVALGYAGTHQTMISNKIMAASIGVVLDAGYEAKIGKSAAFMVKFSLIGGSAGKAKLTDPYGSSNKIRLEGQRESLSSVNITLGLVFGR